MPLEKEALEQVRSSFARCVISTGFIDRFYELFLASHREIAPKFAKTNFDKQKGLLTEGILYALQFAAGNKAGEAGLAPIRKSHNRKKLNIEPRFYQYWVNSLVRAVSEKDYKFTSTLEQDWREALKPVVEFMTSGY
jgi:hemoglobin-like flavoprotein